MLMNELLKTKLFSLLSESSQVTNKEMQNAYDDFVEQVKTLNQSETDHLEVFRALSTTRIEIIFLDSYHQYGQGEKCA
ncbi:MAG: hypothetical protein LIO93_05750 [Bacteroidales bacterium]|nr:hypothetical protein [Bacteroidales bacterium]